MIKRTIIFGFACALLGNIYGQVGVNTESPTSTLDVNGSLRISNNLLAGGDENTPGSAGSDGQFLISKGAGLAPEWQTVTTPVPNTGDWYLLGSLSRVDTKGGARFSKDENTGPTRYPTDYRIVKPKGFTDWTTARNFPERKWVEFEDFAIDLPAYDEELRVIINVQLLAQAYLPSISGDLSERWMSYAVAVFEDIGTVAGGGGYKDHTAELRAVRQGGCMGNMGTTPQELATLVVTLDIPANKATKLLILCTKRANSLPSWGDVASSYLTLGQVLDGGNDALLRRATMRADIYKKVRRD